MPYPTGTGAGAIRPLKRLVKAAATSLLLAVTITSARAADFTPDDLKVVADLRERALQASDSFAHVESLTVEVGPRLAGSKAKYQAEEWALERLKTMGFDRVYTEDIVLDYWERGQASGRVISPYPQNLVVTALGGSVGTPAKGIRAEIVEFDSLQDLKDSADKKVKGKIAFINQRTPRHMEGTGYATTVGRRTQGAVEAAKKGAKAVIIRSVGTSHDRFAHTGSMYYEEGVPMIPAAALSAPDADLITAMLDRGKPVTLELKLSSRRRGQGKERNVIAEIKGREKPDEFVVIGAHLDSWDEGTGAIDDGAGVAIVMETARMIAALPERPRRSIRVILFAAEEIGLVGSKQYVEAHADEMSKIIVALESDFGAGRVFRFDTNVALSALGKADQIMQQLSPLNIQRGLNNAHGGPDVRAFAAKGVPVVTLYQNGLDYFDYHHTPNDTLDKIDPEAMKQNVAAWVVFTYMAAQMDGDFGRIPVLDSRP